MVLKNFCYIYISQTISTMSVKIVFSKTKYRKKVFL